MTMPEIVAGAIVGALVLAAFYAVLAYLNRRSQKDGDW